MNSYWAKIKRDSQYQLEEVLDCTTHLENLQAVLKEFDLTSAPNKKILICYFQEGLRPSIQAQLDNWRQDLDMWDQVMENIVDAKAKTNFQLPFGTKEIDSRCPRDYRLLVKKDKDNANWKHQDKAPKNKAKSHNSFSAN